MRARASTLRGGRCARDRESQRRTRSSSAALPARGRGARLLLRRDRCTARRGRADPDRATARGRGRAELAVDERLVREVADPPALCRDVEVAGRWDGEPGAQAQKRRLPGSVWSGDEQEPVAPDVEPDAAQDALVAVAPFHPPGSNHDATVVASGERHITVRVSFGRGGASHGGDCPRHGCQRHGRDSLARTGRSCRKCDFSSTGRLSGHGNRELAS